MATEMTVLPTARPRVRRAAVLSVHTSPLDQPGTGDAGGLNVYVVETSKRMAAAGVEVDIFTRRTGSSADSVTELVPGVNVVQIAAGPFEGLRKEDLPSQMCAFTSGVLRAEAHRPEGWYDVIHSHYWLSGQVGWLASERWGVPLVHTMHTMAKVKNAFLAEGETPEPEMRVIGEQQVVDASQRIVANTDAEALDLVTLYDADPYKVSVVHPGVDLEGFTPGSVAAARANVGLRPDAVVVLFVGRVQPLKAPDVLLDAAAEMVRHDPSLRDRLVVIVCGGPSGAGVLHPNALHEQAVSLGISDVVRFEAPSARPRLADLYRAADVVVVPSRSESFGLVALEAQACGTPVLAADVGGLRTAVADGVSGQLVAGHDPQTWATALARVIDNHSLRAELGRGARVHAERFGWHATAMGLLETYDEALAETSVLSSGATALRAAR
jgi:D-inositol-3-phosphate glycosyltransferase